MGRLNHRLIALSGFVASAQATLVAPTVNLVGGQCAEEYNAEVDGSLDLFPVKTTLGAKFQATISSDYSLLWEVSYHGSYKLLRNTETQEQHVLYQCGTPMPNITGAKTWQVPVKRAATTSTTYLPFFEMIGERESIVAYTASMDYVSSACVRKLHRDGALAVAYDAASWGADNALLEELAVELTIADGWSSTAHSAYVMTDTAEDSVLKIAEYVEVVALFFNREAEATAAITQMVENYLCVKNAAALVKPAAAVSVLWTQYYDGTWSSAKCPSWYCEIIEAAGGKIMVPEDYGIVGAVERWGDLYMTTEQVVELAAHAEVWISPGAWGSPTFDVANATFASIAALVAEGGSLHGRVFDNQGVNGANDWFERRVVEPDSLLLDVASVLHPDSTEFGNHDRVWLRDVATEAVGTGVTDLDAACPDLANAYAFATSGICGEMTDEPTPAEEGESQDGAAIARVPLLATLAAVALPALLVV